MAFSELHLQVTDTKPQLSCTGTNSYSVALLGFQMCYNESGLAFTSYEYGQGIMK